jgi:hypothetical protein
VRALGVGYCLGLLSHDALRKEIEALVDEAFFEKE